MERIIEFIFALPHSNAMSERLFSLLFHACRKDRNRLTLKNIEAEILVKHNYTKGCKEFYQYIFNNERLIDEIKSSKKYS